MPVPLGGDRVTFIALNNLISKVKGQHLLAFFMAQSAWMFKILAEYAKRCDFCLKAQQARGKH